MAVSIVSNTLSAGGAQALIDKVSEYTDTVLPTGAEVITFQLDGQDIYITTATTTYAFGVNEDCVQDFMLTRSAYVEAQGVGTTLGRTAFTGDYTATADDQLLAARLTAAGTLTLPDPTTLTNGQRFYIKDELCNLDEYPLTIEGTSCFIDGNTQVTLFIPCSALQIYTDTVNYFII